MIGFCLFSVGSLTAMLPPSAQHCSVALSAKLHSNASGAQLQVYLMAHLLGEGYMAHRKACLLCSNHFHYTHEIVVISHVCMPTSLIKMTKKRSNSQTLDYTSFRQSCHQVKTNTLFPKNHAFKIFLCI